MLITDKPEDCIDFNNSVITVRFDADELSSTPQTTRRVPIPIIDDAIDENSEEIFIINLKVSDSITPGGIRVTRRTSVGRIVDNDGEFIISMGLLLLMKNKPLGSTEMFQVLLQN